MSVEFSNVYQEVLLENLDAILKQNLLFQARLKLLEREANVRAEMQAKIDGLTENIRQLNEQLESTQHYKAQAENNDAIVQEKTRIQSALNDTMRELSGVKTDLDARRNEVSSLQNTIADRDVEIKSLKDTVSNLEKLVPAPKVVKKTTVKNQEKPVEISATETNKTRVEVGGTF